MAWYGTERSRLKSRQRLSPAETADLPEFTLAQTLSGLNPIALHQVLANIIDKGCSLVSISCIPASEVAGIAADIHSCLQSRKQRRRLFLDWLGNAKSRIENV